MIEARANPSLSPCSRVAISSITVRHTGERKLVEAIMKSCASRNRNKGLFVPSIRRRCINRLRRTTGTHQSKDTIAKCRSLLPFINQSNCSTQDNMPSTSPLSRNNRYSRTEVADIADINLDAIGQTSTGLPVIGVARHSRSKDATARAQIHAYLGERWNPGSGLPQPERRQSLRLQC